MQAVRRAGQLAAAPLQPPASVAELAMIGLEAQEAQGKLTAADGTKVRCLGRVCACRSMRLRMCIARAHAMRHLISSARYASSAGALRSCGAWCS